MEIDKMPSGTNEARKERLGEELAASHRQKQLAAESINTFYQQFSADRVLPCAEVAIFLPRKQGKHKLSDRLVALGVLEKALLVLRKMVTACWASLTISLS